MTNENWFINNREEFDIPYKYRSDEFYQFPNFEPDENGEFECAAIIVRDLVVFPKMMTPILVDEGLNYNAIQASIKKFETYGMHCIHRLVFQVDIRKPSF